jgi:carbon storage regulator
MLILSRKSGERIRIAEDVEIVVQSIQGSRVLIGIDAPRTTQVVRGELQPDRPAAANRQIHVIDDDECQHFTTYLPR